jgi:hypothetical protein
MCATLAAYPTPATPAPERRRETVACEHICATLTAYPTLPTSHAVIDAVHQRR